MRLLSIGSALFLASAVIAACSSASPGETGGGGATSCAVAPSCPDAGAPSYAQTIEPIIQGECLACHGPGGSAGFDESNYAQVSSQASAILDQVNGCMMPPTDGPSMSDAQRVALTAWLRCGAPDN